MSATDERVVNLPTARLSPERVQLAVHRRRIWSVVVPDGVSAQATKLQARYRELLKKRGAR